MIIFEKMSTNKVIVPDPEVEEDLFKLKEVDKWLKNPSFLGTEFFWSLCRSSTESEAVTKMNN